MQMDRFIACFGVIRLTSTECCSRCCGRTRFTGRMLFEGLVCFSCRPLSNIKASIRPESRPCLPVLPKHIAPIAGRAHRLPNGYWQHTALLRHRNRHAPEVLPWSNAEVWCIPVVLPPLFPFYSFSVFSPLFSLPFPSAWLSSARPAAIADRLSSPFGCWALCALDASKVLSGTPPVERTTPALRSGTSLALAS